jgi:pimeloyl-ACP methyl ester carboxylesterase
MPDLDTFIDVPGGRLRIVAEGDGPPILLVHSAIVDMRSWDAVVPPLVAAGYRVVRYDTRGYGSSTAEDVEFSNRADVIAVLDEVGAGKAAIVGNSRGAMIALDTLIESPERFVAFVWVGGGIGGFDGGATPDEVTLYEEGDALESAGDADGMADLDIRAWVDGIGQPPARVPAAIREAVREMDRPLVESGRVFGKPIPLDGSAANERLGEIRMPTLAVVGALDSSGTRASAARLAETVPGARLITIPDVAHLIGMEVPEGLAALIVEFLAPLPRWS